MLNSSFLSLTAPYVTILDQILLKSTHTSVDETIFGVTSDATDAIVTHNAGEFKIHARFERNLQYNKR